MFLEVTKSKQLSLFRVKYIHILIRVYIQGITNICLFYNLNFGQRARWIYETEARTKNSNLLYSNLSLKKINGVMNVILYQPWRNFSQVYGNFIRGVEKLVIFIPLLRWLPFCCLYKVDSLIRNFLVVSKTWKLICIRKRTICYRSDQAFSFKIYHS